MTTTSHSSPEVYPFASCLDTVVVHVPLDSLPIPRFDDEHARAVGRNGVAWEIAPGIRAEVGTQASGASRDADGLDGSVRVTLGPAILWSRTLAEIAALHPWLGCGELYAVHVAFDYRVIPLGPPADHLNKAEGLPSSHAHSAVVRGWVGDTHVLYELDRIGRSHSNPHFKGIDGATLYRGAADKGVQACLYYKTADHETCAGKVPHYLPLWNGTDWRGIVCGCGEHRQAALWSRCPLCAEVLRYDPVVRLEIRFPRVYLAEKSASLRFADAERAYQWSLHTLAMRAFTRTGSEPLPRSKPRDHVRSRFPWRRPRSTPGADRLTVTRADPTLTGVRRHHRDMRLSHERKLAAAALAETMQEYRHLTDDARDDDTPDPLTMAMTIARHERDSRHSAIHRIRSAVDAIAALHDAPRNVTLHTSSEHRIHRAALRSALRVLARLCFDIEIGASDVDYQSLLRVLLSTEQPTD